MAARPSCDSHARSDKVHATAWTADWQSWAVGQRTAAGEG